MDDEALNREPVPRAEGAYMGLYWLSYSARHESSYIGTLIASRENAGEGEWVPRIAFFRSHRCRRAASAVQTLIAFFLI